MNFSVQIQSYLASKCTAIDIVQSATQRAPAKRTLSQLVAEVENCTEWKANKKLCTLHTVAQATLEDFELLLPACVTIEPRLETLPAPVLAKILQQFSEFKQVTPLAKVCRSLRQTLPGAVSFCPKHVSQHLSHLMEQYKARAKVLAFLAKCPQTVYSDIPLDLTIATSQEEIAVPFVLDVIQKRFPNLRSLTFKEYINSDNPQYFGHVTWMDSIFFACPHLKECRFVGRQTYDLDSGDYPFEITHFPKFLESVDFGPNIFTCDTMQNLFRDCPSLKKFHGKGLHNASLTRTNDSKKTDLEIPYPQTLEELSLEHVEVGQTCEMFLKNCPKLKRLELLDCKIHVHTWLEAYSKYPTTFQSIDVLYLDMTTKNNVHARFLSEDFDPRNNAVEETLALLEETLEKEPSHLLALTFLGAYLWDNAQDLDRAKKLLLQAIEIQPRFTLALKILGDLFRKEGDLEKAKYYFDRVESIDPTDPFVVIRQATLPAAKPIPRGFYDDTILVGLSGKKSLMMTECLITSKLARLTDHNDELCKILERLARERHRTSLSDAP